MRPEYTTPAEILETAEIHYDDRPKDSWVISGPLAPFKNTEVKSSTGRQHSSTQEAKEGLPVSVRVLRDVSQPGLGLWAFLVQKAPPVVHPNSPGSGALLCGDNTTVWVRSKRAKS